MRVDGVDADVTDLRRIPSTSKYKTLAAFTYGLPILLFIIVIIISYALVDPSGILSGAVQVLTTTFRDVPEPSPCEETPQWKECVPMLEVSSYYYDAQRAECRAKESLGKGCLNASNGFEYKYQCETSCTPVPLEAEAIAFDAAAHEIRQRSQHWQRRPRGGRNTSSNATERQRRTFIEAAVLLFEQQPPSKPDWIVAPAQGRSRCRKVLLEECVSSDIKTSVVFDPDTNECNVWDYSKKGCYRNTKIFYTKPECLKSCVHRTPEPHTCLRPIVGQACEEQLHKLQWFYNPLRSSCEHLSELCLAGRNRFPSYAACTETCLTREDTAVARL